MSSELARCFSPSLDLDSDGLWLTPRSFATSAIARDPAGLALDDARSDPSPVEYQRTESLDLDFPPLNKVAPTHGVHVATLHLRAHHPFALDIQARIAMHAASSLKIPTSGQAYLPTKTELQTVIKAPFVHKKSQENFVRKTHKRAIKVFDADREVVDLWLRYLRRNAMGGVGMKAYIHEFVEFGFAAGEMANLQSQLAGGKIEKAAEEIVKAFSGLEFEPEAPAVVEPKAEGKVEAKEAKEEVKADAAETKEVKVEEVEAKTEEVKTEAKEEPAPVTEAEAKEETPVAEEAKEETKA